MRPRPHTRAGSSAPGTDEEEAAPDSTNPYSDLTPYEIEDAEYEDLPRREE